MIASKRKSKDIRCPPAKPSRHLPASARPWQAGPSRHARHHGTQRRRTGGARRTGHENRPLIDNSLQLMNWQHMICHNSSVQDNSISIDAAMCPKRIVTGMLEFTTTKAATARALSGQCGKTAAYSGTQCRSQNSSFSNT